MSNMEIQKNLSIYGIVKIDDEVVVRFTQNFSNDKKLGGVSSQIIKEDMYIKNIEECRKQEYLFIEEVRKIEDENLLKLNLEKE